MGRKKQTRKSPDTPPPPPSPDSIAVLPAAKGRVVVYVGAGLYILVCLLILRSGGDDSIGAICGDQCGGSNLLGIRLEVLGGLLIGAIAILRAVFDFGRSRMSVAAIAGALASIHAGASVAFAASQLLGLVPVCVLCLFASALSLGVAIGCFPLLVRAYTIPWIPTTQSVVLGVISVMAMWPFLEIESGEPETVMVNSPSASLPVTTPETVAELPPATLRAMMDALVIGDPTAPTELVVLSDFSCNICKRFEDRTLPDLMEQGVETGLMRIRFVFTAQHGGEEMARRKLVALNCLAAVGAPVNETLPRVREENLVSIPQGIHLAQNESSTARALEVLKTIAEDNGWDAVLAEHERIDSIMREKYFPGDSATPLFITLPGSLDPENLPSEEDVYKFRGYQKADPFLEFAKKH